MEQGKVELLAELEAIKYVLEHVAKIAFLAAKLDPAHATTMRSNAKELLSKETFPGMDAALADHLADEIAVRVDRILSGVEEKVTSAYQAPRSEPKG